MVLDRPFDDERWPSLEGLADCFVCGRAVDPRDANRGTWEEPPAGPRLPIHLRCLNDRQPQLVSHLYHKALDDMSRHSIVAKPGSG